MLRARTFLNPCIRQSLKTLIPRIRADTELNNKIQRMKPICNERDEAILREESRSLVTMKALVLLAIKRSFRSSGSCNAKGSSLVPHACACLFDGGWIYLRKLPFLIR